MFELTWLQCQFRHSKQRQEPGRCGFTWQLEVRESPSRVMFFSPPSGRICGICNRAISADRSLGWNVFSLAKGSHVFTLRWQTNVLTKCSRVRRFGSGNTQKPLWRALRSFILSLSRNQRRRSKGKEIDGFSGNPSALSKPSLYGRYCRNDLLWSLTWVETFNASGQCQARRCAVRFSTYSTLKLDRRMQFQD